MASSGEARRSGSAQAARAPADRRRRRARARRRVGRHPLAERRRAPPSASSRDRGRSARLVERLARRAQQLGVERGQPRRGAPAARRPGRRRASRPRRVQLARDAIDQRRRTPRRARPSPARAVSRSTTRSRCAGSDGRRGSGLGTRAVGDRGLARRRLGRDQPERATPLVEHVEHVGLAEVDRAPAAGAAPCGSSARNSDRCRGTRP